MRSMPSGLFKGRRERWTETPSLARSDMQTAAACWWGVGGGGWVLKKVLITEEHVRLEPEVVVRVLSEVTAKTQKQ